MHSLHLSSLSSIRKAIEELERGLGAATVVTTTRIRKFGSNDLCSTDEEEAEAREAHFKNLLERTATYDPDVVNLIEQLPVQYELDDDISIEEIDAAVRKLNLSGPGMTGVHATAIKCCYNQPATRGMIIDIITGIWKDMRY